MTNLILFWHRRDLRITDNRGLAFARQRTNKIVGVFCLDPNILKSDDIAPARVVYLLECLAELQRSYRGIGSQLLIINGEPTQKIPELVEALKAECVFWNADIEPYARKRDEIVAKALVGKSIETSSFWDLLLHAPETIMTQSNNTPYTVYTPFWKNWIKQEKDSSFAKLDNIIGLDDRELEIAKKQGAIDLPTAQDLGFIWKNDLLLAGGETAARERLEFFCQNAIYNYQEDRNYPAIDGTSQLSAALKFGAIGIRMIWQATIEALTNSNSDETTASIQTWQQELAWREFYQHCLYFFPELAEGAYRKEFKDFPWENNEKHFQAWCEGKTGYPIVDAAMRQLNETGWMHNRCRMIVASFLTKDLTIDWRWGEKYFMQKLYDGDLAANNGGWQWSASSGMDPKPLRIFNPASQAQKFDAEGDYIRQWLPELSSVDTEDLLSGNIPSLFRHQANYPVAIVDHKKQQAKFKELYKQQKTVDS
jgi:deoxyribodipyrimidine photo-lyase